MRRGRARVYAAYGMADVAQAVALITTHLFADAYNRAFVARQTEERRALTDELWGRP